MTDAKRHKSKDIPMEIEGASRYVTGVNKYTTCGDVIKMVLRKTDIGKENMASYAIFESSRGIDRILSGKERISKVMRTWGSSESNFKLVLRKTSPVLTMPKLSEAKRKKLMNHKVKQTTHDTSSGSGSINARGKYENTAQVHGYVHSHETKLNKGVNEFVKEIYFDDDSDGSMDVFNSNVDKSNMAGFPNCGAVNSTHINRVSHNEFANFRSPAMVDSTDVVVNNNVNHVKFAVKKNLRSKKVHDLSSGNESANRPMYSKPHKQHRENDSYYNIASVSSQNIRPTKRHEKLACDIKTKIAKMSQKEGKEALLQKYFADYICYQSPSHGINRLQHRERGDGSDVTDAARSYRAGDGAEQEPAARPIRIRDDMRRAYDCASDSGQEDNFSELDVAFVSDHVCERKDVKMSTVRRLVDYDHTQTPCNLVDYSLSDNDISTCSSDPSEISSISDAVRNIFEEHITDLDEDMQMESFMNTKVFEDFSDEGLSSMGSDDEKEILV